MSERMRRGWELTKKSWSVVRSNTGLVRFPIYGGIAALIWMLTLGAGGAALLAIDEADVSLQVAGGVLVALGAYLATLSVIYFNVALAAAADEALQGRTPDLAAARAAATSRLGAIAGWAVISVVVSTLLSIIRDRAGAAGGILAAIGGTIWSLVTFLVVPVLALEQIGPIAAMKRSASLFRQRWGQQITGNVVIGGIAGLVTLVGVLMFAGGVALIVSDSTAGLAGGVALVVVGIVVTITAAVFAGAVRGVFGVALYRYVADDTTVGPFDSRDMESAVRQTA